MHTYFYPDEMEAMLRDLRQQALDGMVPADSLDETRTRDAQDAFFETQVALMRCWVGLLNRGLPPHLHGHAAGAALGGMAVNVMAIPDEHAARIGRPMLRAFEAALSMLGDTPNANVTADVASVAGQRSGRA